jgi:hypothetical protein
MHTGDGGGFLVVLVLVVVLVLEGCDGILCKRRICSDG